MDSLDFINTHKLILNNKEIDTIETNGNTDNKTILTKSAVNNAISSAISGGSSEFKGTFIGEYKSVDNNNPKVKINENGITLDNKSITSIKTVTPSIADNNIITSKGFTEKTYAKLSDTSQEITSNMIISTTIKTASSSVNINDTNGIITNQIKIGGSSAPEISSVITSSGTTGSDTNLYTGLKIDHLLDTKLNSSDAVGQKYYVSNELKGERFNDYINNHASGYFSHASGRFTTASGLCSFAHGEYITANSCCMTTFGRYNTNDGVRDNIINRFFIIGNGESSNHLSDAFEVYNSGEVKINSTKSGSIPKLTIGNSTTNGRLSLDGTNYVSNILIGTSTSSSDKDKKLTTQGYNDVTYAKLTDSTQTITSGTIKSNIIQTTGEKNIVNYTSTSPTSLTYGNITDETIINGKNNIIKINNTVNVNNIKPYSIDTTNNKSTITLGFNEKTTLESDHTTKKDTLTTNNISTTGTIESAGLITANNGLFIPYNESLTLGGSNSVSSVVIASGSSNNDKLTTQGYTDAIYAKLSSANAFAGVNTFANIIYANGGISAYKTNISNTNNIKMSFNNYTDPTTSLRNDFVEFQDNNSTPNTLLKISQDGKTYSPVFTTQNADYAELFEVYDESIPIKDYEYKFITLIDDKVKIASNEDDYILGVYSLKPGIIGNYNLDELNDKKNIQVGLLGRLVVIDNNTCKANSYCKVDKDGCAIPYNKSDGDVPHYRVMKRIDNNKILIMFK